MPKGRIQMKLIRIVLWGMLVGSTFVTYSMNDECKDDRALPAKKQSALNRSLYLAAKRGNLVRVEQLFAQGAEINVRSIQAPPGGPLLDGAHDNGKAIFPDQPLCAAAENGHLEVVEWLLKNQADANAQSGPCGQRPLERAAWNNHSAVVDNLMEKKADVDGGDRFGGAALMAAARQGHTSMVEKLLGKFHANANQLDNEGRNALWHAAECCTGDHVPVINLLVAQNIDLNTHNKYDQTAVYFTAGRNVQATELLVTAGADTTLRDKHGITPVDRAFRLLQTEGIRDTYDFFVLHGAKAGAAIPHQGDIGKLVRNKGKARHWG
jgi:ankyrin repeat protein